MHFIDGSLAAYGKELGMRTTDPARIEDVHDPIDDGLAGMVLVKHIAVWQTELPAALLTPKQ